MLEIIQKDPRVSYEDIAALLKKDRTTIRRNIQKLKSLGILQRSGANKNGSWIVLKL